MQQLAEVSVEAEDGLEGVGGAQLVEHVRREGHLGRHGLLAVLHGVLGVLRSGRASFCPPALHCMVSLVKAVKAPVVCNRCTASVNNHPHANNTRGEVRE